MVTGHGSSPSPSSELIGPFALLASAERRLSSSTSGLLVAAVPIIGAVLARLTGGQDRLTAVRWAGLIIGFGGVALLAGPDAARGDALSVAEVLLTALGYAIGPIIANRKLSGLPPVAANTVCLGMAAVAYAPAAALTWPHSMPSVQVLASLAGLGAICTAAGFVVYFGLIAEVGAARATVITYVNPAVAVALGVLVLGEHLTAAMAGSFALILAGSILATRANPGARRPAPRTPRIPWTSRAPWGRRVRPAAGPLGDRGPSATDAAADGPGPCRPARGRGRPRRSSPRAWSAGWCRTASRVPYTRPTRARPSRRRCYRW